MSSPMQHVPPAGACSRRTWGRWAAGLLVGAALVVAIVMAATRPATAASSSVTVTMTVQSSTSLDTSGCASGTPDVTSFGVLIPGTTTITGADCAVAFGSTNDTAKLLLSQRDALGRGLWQNTAGTLDATFDGDTGLGDGIVSTAIGSANDVAYTMAVQPDGKIVAVGYARNTTDDFAVVRYLTDGRLDPAFDGDSGTGNGKVTTDFAGAEDRPFAVAIQPDGKILVVGHAVVGGVHDFAIARYEADGRLDATFDGDSGTANGRVTTGIGASTDAARGVAVQDDGRIVATGYAWNGSNYDFATARYLGDGRLDPDFDGDSGTGNGKVVTTIGAESEYAYSAVVQDDGRIVVGGYVTEATNDDFAIVRYEVDGRLDVAFDGDSGTGDGKVRTAVGAGNDPGLTVALQPDGKLLLGGYSNNGVDDDFALVRYLSDGRLDPDFDGDSGSGNGKVTTSLLAADRARTVAVMPDGGIVLAGYSHNGTDYDYGVVRYLADGRLDEAFDGSGGSGNGKLTISLGAGSDLGWGIGVQHDGRLVVAGYTHNGVDYDIGILQFDAARIDDYVTSFGTGTSSFGACLHTLVSATGTWPVAGSGGCTEALSTNWRPVVPGASDTGALVASTGAVGATAQANFRFGVRPASDQRRGGYLAPMTFQVVAPAA